MDFQKDLSLLILRVTVGTFMFFQHGWPKILGFSSKMDSFPDPIGLGSTISLALTVFAEGLCSILLVLGLLTRFAVWPLIIVMLVAIFVVHAKDPWASRELACLYAAAFCAVGALGPGSISLDRFFKKG